MVPDIYLPIVDMYVDGLALVTLGLVVGFISGFFGVGGGIIAVPMLYILFDIPFPVAIGTGLALIIGTCVSASYRHHDLGNIDFKMGVVFMAATFVGVEVGARLVQGFKKMGNMSIAGRPISISDFVMSILYIVLLCSVGLLVLRESLNLRRNTGRLRNSIIVRNFLVDQFRGVSLKPRIKFESAGKYVSLWTVLAISVAVGFLKGLLGVGGGFILVPAMIYLLKVPTKTAIGTSLFSLILGGIYGTFTHTIKGNVDIVLVTVLLVGSAVGAQFGAHATARFRSAHIRFAFSLLTFAAAIMAVVKLIVTACSG